MVWSVVLLLPLPPFDFAAPHGYSGPVPVGFRVVVPWKGVPTVGWVTGPGSEMAHRLREVIAVLDDRPFVDPKTLQALAQWSDLAQIPFGLLFADLLPISHFPLRHEVSQVSAADLSAFGVQSLEDWTSVDHLDGPRLDAIREQGLLLERVSVAPKMERVYVAQRGQGQLTPKQAAAWDVLVEQGTFSHLAEWARQAGVGTSVVSALVSKGWACSVDRLAPFPELPIAALQGVLQTPFPINFQELPPVYRYHGGTLRARFGGLSALISEVLDQGKSVLYIVPDHFRLDRSWRALSHLTPVESKASLKFSGSLTEEERTYAWDQVLASRVRLVIGTWVALCLPLDSLGLIVVEEEGSDAYKLMSGARVFVPELATGIAKGHGVPLLLTGSTPAVESMLYPGKVLEPGAHRIHVVDYLQDREQKLGPMSALEFRTKGLGWPLAFDLRQALKQVASRGRQGVVVAPRKGYSALLQCSCGWVSMCPNCDLSLRVYADQRLECHQCGHVQDMLLACPECQGTLLKPKGPGVEWIFGEVKRLLPDFPVYQFDREHQDDLSLMSAGEPGVIVGTSAMLSRAAPPNLALIGITFADAWLSLSDFRATERYHAFLRSLIEWHPRHVPLMVIQTFQAQNPALQAVLSKDAGFYPELELVSRRQLGYPPFVHLVQVTITGRDGPQARTRAMALREALMEAGALDSEILGPAPSSIARIKGRYVYQLLIRVQEIARLTGLLGLLRSSHRGYVRWDIHPRGSVSV